MCGICGFAGQTGDIEGMLQTLRYRGPDDTGKYQSEQCCLGSARLAIEDPKNGQQPFSKDGLHLVYNGEIYRYDRTGLQTKCDTEYVLKLFSQYREQAFGKLNGQFALAVFDENTQQLYLARDRFGIKPLFYRLADGIQFGSEIKALPKSQIPQPGAVHLYFAYGYVPAPLTAYADIAQLDAGTFLRYDVRTKQITICKYEDTCPADLSIEAAVASTVSETPTGLLFSGGVDSTAIAVALKRCGLRLPCYYVRYTDYKNTWYFDEYEYALGIAKHLDMDFRVVEFNAQTVLNDIPRVVGYLDEPFFDTSCFSVNHVLRAAKQDGIKVLLTGDGGDELFGGYYSFSDAGKPVRDLFNSFLSMAAWPLDRHPLEKLILHPPVNILAAQYSFVIDCMRYNALPTHENVSQVYLNGFMKNDILVKVDRMAALNSVETRHPLLQNMFVNGISQLSTNKRFKYPKQVLKEYLQGTIPDYLLHRKKQGFTFPAHAYLQGALSEQILQQLSPDYLRAQGLFDPDYVQTVVQTAMAIGKPIPIWVLLMFQWWHALHQ